MFERFTEEARQVVVSAGDEARGLQHDYIGTEHLLLGLLNAREGGVRDVLRGLGLSVEGARAQVVHLVGEGEATVNGGQVPLTPRAKKTLELALREALQLGDGYVGAEHVLLGLARLNEGVGAVILAGSDATAPKVAAAVLGARGTSDPKYVESFSEEAPSATKVVATQRRGLLISGWPVFALAFGLGILVGWLVWGL